MTITYYPGCKVKAAYPKESAALEDYILGRGDIRVTGCCRKNWEGFGPDDTAVVVCNNCHEILGESSGQRIVNVYQILNEDPHFNFPDYGGEQMALQDCWIATGNHQAQYAVRSLLKKMNIQVIELANNRDDCRFCGTNIITPASASNVDLAPRRWVDKKAAELQLIPAEEWDAYFHEQCKDIPTEKVACYCKFCGDGLSCGGKKPVHILQLLFPEA
ncbi:MAG: hypothetical protein Q4E12_07970 [Coriobacteriia bacterium]|nr:hypothetical protein [Coriobacteriia bacterium]